MKIKGIFANNSAKTHLITCFLLVLALLCAAATLTADWQQIRDQQKAQSSQLTPEMQHFATQLPFTPRGRTIFLATNPTFVSNFSAECHNPAHQSLKIDGCYFTDGTNEQIEIFDQPNSAQQKTIAIHETLHAAYNRLDHQKQATTCSILQEFAATNQQLQAELAHYSAEHACTELFARVGSEFASNDAALSDQNREQLSKLSPIYAEFIDIESITPSVATLDN
ncbi:hypothetical protein IJ847_01880 [Candidatus Saccharibacteria bacterium]|nr:hypothetical protein [Candidatus Saccharibacteria bacterium]